MTTNQRMINSISVGIVYVGGTGDYTISNAEKIHILAKVSEGLDDLASNEPDAKISWNYSTLTVNLNNFIPWEGANWPGLNLDFYKGPDAALWSEPNQRIYFFKRGEYYRINPNNGWKPDNGYPKPIAGNWPGMPSSFTNGIDAALWSQTNQKIYFFKGSQYVRIDPSNSWQVDSGYPKPIAGNWPGFPTEFENGVDAAIYCKNNNRIYFFKGEDYIRITPSSSWNVENGYPKKIVDHWPGIPTSYIDPNVPYQGGAGIDSALWSDTNQRIYFFKKGSFWEGSYVRINPAAGWAVEAGYPKPVGLSTSETEALWRDKAQQQLGHDVGGEGLKQLNNSLKSATNAQSGFVTFFTKLPTMWHGYAGGIRVVMRKTPPSDFLSWTSIDNVMAHETGHMFGAPDEYAGSKCGCDDMRGRFIKAPNGNCAFNSCAASPTNCLMKNNTPTQLCPFTPYHIGWGAFLEKIDSSIYSFKNNKIYLFNKDYYIRYTKDFKFEDGYPKKIEGNWPGWPTDFLDGVDAGLYAKKNNRIYFFKGDKYIRINPNNGWQVDAGYPKSINGNWPGFPASFANGIDAALWSEKNKRIYFFKNNQYIKVNPDSGWAVQSGYPKYISGNWPGFPSTFASGVDSALWSEKNDRIYFFKGTEYIRVNPNAGWNVEANYPKPINKNWKMMFPA